MDRDLLEALYRKAVGGTVEEVTEEYGREDDLLKRKVTCKYIPPDVSANKAYMELAGADEIANMTDEELEKEKARLLEELKKTSGSGGEPPGACDAPPITRIEAPMT